jgi:hypothetical protein
VPISPAYTPRQLRTIADRVEALTKARHNNQAMGVPTTPDRFDCRFPSGHRGTVAWTQAELTSERSRDRNGGRTVHRYTVELEQPAVSDDEIVLRVARAIHHNRFPDSSWDAQIQAVRADYIACASAVLQAAGSHVPAALADGIMTP